MKGFSYMNTFIYAIRKITFGIIDNEIRYKYFVTIFLLIFILYHTNFIIINE